LIPATIAGLWRGASEVQRLDLGEHLVGDQRAFRELLAAVHDAMGHHADLAGAADDPAVLRGERGDHGLERFGEGALEEVAGRWALRAVMRVLRAVEADALHDAARVAGRVGRVEESCT